MRYQLLAQHGWTNVATAELTPRALIAASSAESVAEAIDRSRQRRSRQEPRSALVFCIEPGENRTIEIDHTDDLARMGGPEPPALSERQRRRRCGPERRVHP
jgi:hypothetical protein